VRELVNEGELEDWLAMYEMSRAKAALSRLRDPIFVVSGNHDISGWDDSPPPEGTGRRPAGIRFTARAVRRGSEPSESRCSMAPSNR